MALTLLQDISANIGQYFLVIPVLAYFIFSIYFIIKKEIYYYKNKLTYRLYGSLGALGLIILLGLIDAGSSSEIAGAFLVIFVPIIALPTFLIGLGIGKLIEYFKNK